MSDKNYWDIEDKLFKHFKLKEDSESFSEIYVTGYEEYYLENRDILKKSNIEEWTNKILKPKDWRLPNNHLEMTREELHKLYDDMFQGDKEITYIAVGFVYLKYQLDIPTNIKKSIIDSIDFELTNTKKAKIKYNDDHTPYYDKHIEHLLFFKNCIKKEDGEGLITVESILPKRSLYD